MNCLEFTINRSTIKRAREHFRKQSSEAIKSTFIDQNLNYIIVHWDSKLLPDILSKEIIDRLPAIVLASNVEKLLGVPALNSGTGKEISSAVYNLLLDWNLVDKVQAFVFDTTASNSGRLNGACVLLEQLLNSDILLFACRHHIFEIVLQAVFAHVKITVTSGPDIPLFKRFKSNWKNIDSSNFRIYSTFQNSHKNLKDVANDISLFCIQRLNDNFPRDDYREFLELVLIFLGGSPPRGIKFRQPGAYHLARWMAKAIYCIKILLFSDQFKMTTREQNSLDEVCCFIVKCYIQEWITAPNPVTAPMNDMLFLNKPKNYNGKLEVAIRKCINHLWYLNEECAVFSIFDDRINNETKQRMANYILEGKEQYSNDNEEENEESKNKLNLKFDDLTNFLNKDLPFDLLTNKSWKLFARFHISDIFLRADPSTWKDIEEYKQAKEVISSLKIVNDAAEGGVKLMEEYNQTFSKG